MEIKNGLCTQKYTKIYAEDKVKWAFNAPHHFIVGKADCEDKYIDPIEYVNFQEGPIKEYGINGVNNEDLILMVITRLQAFQESPYKCRENAMAITKLEECLMWLRKRTLDREVKGIEGTSEI